MPPKKREMNGQDIRSFFKRSESPGNSSFTTDSTQPGGAAGRQGNCGGNSFTSTDSTKPDGAADSKIFTRSQVKKEINGDSMDGHLHRFTVKFGHSDQYKYSIDCHQACTVLDAITSTEIGREKMKKFKNIVIQLGKGDRESIVATHFPCSCITDGESLIISFEAEKVEEAQNQQYTEIQSRDKYSVFYVDTVGGLHTKRKKLFRNNAVKNAVKKFKYLCIYGEKGWTVEEALKRDGRFIDNLGNFSLSDNDNPNCITERTQKVDNLDKKEFKIRLPRYKGASDGKRQENSDESHKSEQRCGTVAVFDAASQRGISVRTAVENSGSTHDTEEVYTLLREQFPALKQWMESRFTESSYQETLNLRKEDFGKIQKLFSEVHRVRKLLKLGESVCKVVVENGKMGTGFVLFDNFILTNAHLFESCVEGEKLKEGTNVYTLFNYDDPEPHTNYYYFELAHPNLCYSKDKLDYAIYELNPEGQKPNQTTQAKKVKVPPGLLKHFGPMPENGEACLIGHPAGEVKKIDPTCIIEKENRKQAVNDHIHPHIDCLFTVTSITHLLRKQGIEKIMKGGSKEDTTVTYNTFMYHGSSGSPVFDAHCRVFGLHTAGFTYGFQNQKDSVIEFAQPLLTIFEDFVSKLKAGQEEELLRRVEREANSNEFLKKVLNTMPTDNNVPTDPDESSDSDESMETD